MSEKGSIMKPSNEYVSDSSLAQLARMYSSKQYNQGVIMSPTVNFHCLNGLGVPELLDRQARAIHVITPKYWDVTAYVSANMFHLTYQAPTATNEEDGFMLITPRAAEVMITLRGSNDWKDAHYIVKYYRPYHKDPIYLYKEHCESVDALKEIQRVQESGFERIVRLIAADSINLTKVQRGAHAGGLTL